ncbi:MAG TPA: GNAT family N-acetyltransferase [Thermomicrobiales bacterium]|nr:GNAT family N-acetyltransferase [Thermomicrobiales bacterium]
MTVLTLRAYTQQSPLLEDALQIYARVWPDRDPEVARETFTRYAGYPGFSGFVAFIDDEPAGVGYGAQSSPGVPWHDLVAPRLGVDRPEFQDAFRIVELAADEAHQGKGIGGQLHDRLLAAQPCRRALISTNVTNLRARGIYERRGWTYLHTAFDVPDDPHQYVIMAQELGARDNS